MWGPARVAGALRLTDGDRAGEGSYDQAEAQVDPRGEG
jgi:hypothetical protein